MVLCVSVRTASHLLCSPLRGDRLSRLPTPHSSSFYSPDLGFTSLPILPQPMFPRFLISSILYNTFTSSSLFPFPESLYPLLRLHFIPAYLVVPSDKKTSSIFSQFTLNSIPRSEGVLRSSGIAVWNGILILFDSSPELLWLTKCLIIHDPDKNWLSDKEAGNFSENYSL